MCGKNSLCSFSMSYFHFYVPFVFAYGWWRRAVEVKHRSIEKTTKICCFQGENLSLIVSHVEFRSWIIFWVTMRREHDLGRGEKKWFVNSMVVCFSFFCKRRDKRGLGKTFFLQCIDACLCSLCFHNNNIH